MASAEEVECGSLFLNARRGSCAPREVTELGHHQMLRSIREDHITIHSNLKHAVEQNYQNALIKFFCGRWIKSKEGSDLLGTRIGELRIFPHTVCAPREGSNDLEEEQCGPTLRVHGKKHHI